MFQNIGSYWHLPILWNILRDMNTRDYAHEALSLAKANKVLKAALKAFLPTDSTTIP